MRVAIVGSRDYPDLIGVRNYVYRLPQGTVVVSGGARGVDQDAEFAARQIGHEVLIFPAYWRKFGPRAGYLRNVQIVENCDRVVAFWDGKSKGTKHTIDIATERGIPVEVVRIPPQEAS